VFRKVGRFLVRVEFQLHARNVCLVSSPVKAAGTSSYFASDS
jgi:hypothetical protein